MFKTYKTTEFKDTVDVQNHEFGWIRLKIFFKLLNNDDANYIKNSIAN